MSKYFWQKTLFLIIIGLFFTTTLVVAQDIGFGTLDDVAAGGQYKIITGENLTDTIVGEIIAWVLGFVGVLFLGLVIYSGFQWMSAGGNTEQVDQSKKRIISSAVGLGLVFFAFIISNVVFGFFYKQTGRDDQTARQAPANEMGKISCTKNSDCPSVKPICTGIEITGKWCTCTSDTDCANLPTPYCVTPVLGTNFCGECSSDNHCGPNQKCKDGECKNKQ